MPLSLRAIRSLACSVALLAALPAASHAEEATEAPASLLPYGFSLTLGAVSDYTFLGITQTGGEPAIQGSIDWAHDSGFYLGVWSSNVDFEDNSNTKLELDYYGGYNHSFANGLETDISLLHVQYFSPKSGFDYDYDEAKLMLDYPLHKLFSVNSEFRYSPDYAGDSGEEYYVQGGVSVPLPYDLTFGATAGYQWVEENDNYGYPDYANWRVGFDYTYAGTDFGLHYSDTNIDKSDCESNCDGRFVLSVSRTF